MATLQDAIDQIQAEMKSLPGMRLAPSEPPDSLDVFPFSVCYAEAGEYNIGPPELMTGLHTIVVEIHVSRRDLVHDVRTAMRYAKSAPNEIFDAFKSGTLTAIQTLERITYTFGGLGWGGAETLGFRFRLERVKTQDEIS